MGPLLDFSITSLRSVAFSIYTSRTARNSTLDAYLLRILYIFKTALIVSDSIVGSLSLLAERASSESVFPGSFHSG